MIPYLQSGEKPIVQESFRKILTGNKEQIIRNSKNKRDLNRREFFLSPETAMQKLIRLSAHMHRGMSMNIRNVVLVVAVLVATAVYQATLTPPSGVTHGSTVATPGDLTTNVLRPLDPSSEMTTTYTRKVHKHFTLYVSMNTLAFNLALGVMLFVIPFVLYSVFLHLALYFMSVSFLIMLEVSGGQENHTAASVLMYVSLGLFGIAYSARFFIASLKTILWLPWWKVKGWPYRWMHRLIEYMGMQNSFQKLQLQVETVGWSGDPYGSYYRQ